MTDNETVDLVPLVLVIIGGLNWGLVGLGSFIGTELDLVQLTVGQMSGTAADVIYMVVGLAALYTAYFAYDWYQ